jgi:hypothetical protein
LSLWLIAVAALVLGACGALLALTGRRRYRAIEERLGEMHGLDQWILARAIFDGRCSSA